MKTVFLNHYSTGQKLELDEMDDSTARWIKSAVNKENIIMKVANKIMRDGLEKIWEPSLYESPQGGSIDNSVSPKIELTGVMDRDDHIEMNLSISKERKDNYHKKSLKDNNSESSADEEYSDERLRMKKVTQMDFSQVQIMLIILKRR